MHPYQNGASIPVILEFPLIKRVNWWEAPRIEVLRDEVSFKVFRTLQEKTAHPFVYKDKDEDEVAEDITKYIDKCGPAWLGSGLGTGPACDNCPNQLNCLGIEEKLKVYERKS